MNESSQNAPVSAFDNASELSQTTTPSSPSSPPNSSRGQQRSGLTSNRSPGPGHMSSIPSTPGRTPERATPRNQQNMSLQQMKAVSHHANRVEQVDVAIIGAGLCGLACAVALHKVRPDCVIKVYERRPGPALVAPEPHSNQHYAAAAAAIDDLSLDDHVPSGGGVRLEANGLKALTAISRKVAAAAMSQGLFAQHVLLHDTETGAVISHLHDQPRLTTSSSPRQPALVVGWSELEQLLLDQLPEDTVHWGAIATSYKDITSQGVVEVELLKHKHTAEDKQQLTASPAEANSRTVTPFQVLADGAAATGSNWGNSSRNMMGPKLIPPPAAGAAAANGSSGSGFVLERVTVEARVVIATDGPMSLIRQQMTGDGPPQFDGTVRWVGRLAGDLLSTIPVAHEAWWLGPGVTFNSHPLRCGDVVWEAQVSSSTLATAGLRWDEASHSLVPLTPSQDSSGPGPDSQAAPQAAAAAAATGADEGQQGGSVEVTGNGAVTDKELSAVAAAPAGEWETAAGDEVVAAARDAAAANEGAAGSDRGAVQATVEAETEGRMSTQSLLQKLFALFPAPVLDMISATPPGCVLEAAVHTRPARLLPPSLGRGGVAVLGQAACPLRPTGQECSQALEDAAELGSSVMCCGVSREALRRLEIRRRPRWKHAMQVSQALGSVSNLGGVSLHQGLLSYTTQLHSASFVPLRTVPQHKRNRTKQLMKLAAYALLASGAITGVSGLVGQLKDGHEVSSSNPLHRIFGGVGEAAGGMVASVTSAAAQFKKAVKVGGEAEKGLQQGIETAVSAVTGVADELVGRGTSSDEGGSKVVYGEVPAAKSGFFGRAKDAVLGRVVSVGALVGRPFIGVAKNRVSHQVASNLGAF